jgi:uncharacterized cupredoxin-like copper-binding protein
MKRMTLLAVVGAALAVAFAVVAFRGDGGAAEAAPSAQTTTIQVTIGNNSMTATPSSAPAGEINFVVSNAGSMNHEFVIIRTDLAVDALPVAGGQVDENGAGVQVIDEIEPFAPGTEQTISVNLTSGAYVLICNLPGHYQLGIRTTFTVTEGAATETPTSTTTPTATPTVGATETATATVTATPIATASPISATVTPEATPSPTKTATPTPTAPSPTGTGATPTPTGTVTGVTQPPATGGGGSDGDGGLPLAAWAAIGAAAFVAVGAAAATFGRWPRRESGR